MKKQKYYSLIKNKSKKEATLNIFGDITSYPWSESDVSNYNLSKQLQELSDVDTINVHINSYGGEVAEGLAIYNSLKNHKAKVKTFCDGFACSIASVIFMAGDERIMSNASLLMIHNAWSFASGNASELRKQADDLDKITQASVNAYMTHINISEEELKKLLDNETWLSHEEALEKGFATSVTNEDENSKASQSVKKTLVNMILKHKQENDIDVDIDTEGGDGVEKYECSECGYIYEGELPEFFVCPECGAEKEAFIELEEDEEVTEQEEVNDEEIETEETNEEQDGEENNGDEEAEEDEEENNGDEQTDEEDKVTNEKMATFFNAIIGGMK